MESILKLITIDDDDDETLVTRVSPSLNYDSFPFCIFDISLPQCKTGFVYFLISLRKKDFSYIGDCKCILQGLRNHNSGYDSTSTTTVHGRPYAVMGYICGFNGGLKALQKEIKDR